ncbi:MAG: flagellar biosynthetic protein FliR [Acetobacteraceae bacterium]|nr:flagellar biosynthetic protein FliR [Acetobacteraceae bacterium]
MTPEALGPLAFHAVLVLARIGGAVMLLPGLGEAEVPATIRLGLVLALVALLLPGQAAQLPPIPEAPAELLRLVALETATGLWIGLLARLIALALAQAGQVIGLMIGLASPLQGDLLFGAQGVALSRLLALLAAVLVLASGLYALPLRALAESYAVLPVGAPLAAGPVAETVVVAAGESLGLALRLAGPFVLLAVLGNLALALIARVAPQVQVLIIAVPAQILAGILLLTLLLPALLAAWQEAARAGLGSLPGLR